ncbi:MAG TPA: GNAT family N-acetyltransferase [Candidatus Limnocylindria bacterium]|jgi:GNAT superfamily N-acetyltransferase|nr:GNAT family N-acetyltransferase [Candidatus Limnocylindria bacterium]
MNIARATAGDVDPLVVLMASSPLLRRYGVARRSARASLVDARRSGDLLLVTREHKAIAGLAWIVPTRALDRAAYLRLLLVAEGHQSRGVGAALLADGERRVKRLGCRHMVLLVTTTNRRARSFYKSQGYRYVGGLPGFVRPRIGESLYAKTL